MTRLVCGPERRDVQVTDDRGGLRVSVDGAAFMFVLREVSPGTYVLGQGERVEMFNCVRDGDQIHLFWRGTVYRLQQENERTRAAAQRALAAGLQAPMPGRVIAVKAAVGERVARGQEILVVESMKMENAIRAPHEGTVKSIAARVGDMVAPGTTLVELE